jgi:hypothetical protein
MSRLLVWVTVLGSLLLVATFVPIGGRTVAERFQAAPSTLSFAEQGVKEIVEAARRLWGVKPEPRKQPLRALQQAKAAARTSRGGAGPAKEAAVPQEHHTAADRDALDRIVAEHASPSR